MREFIQMRALTSAVVAIALGCSSVTATAHSTGASGFASITVNSNTVRYSMSMMAVPMPSELAERMHFGQPGVAPSYQPLADAIAQKIELKNGDARCVAGASQVAAPTAGSGTPTVIVDFVCARAID